MTAPLKADKRQKSRRFVVHQGPALGDIRRATQEVLRDLRQRQITVDEADARLRKQSEDRSIVDWILSY